MLCYWWWWAARWSMPRAAGCVDVRRCVMQISMCEMVIYRPGSERLRALLLQKWYRHNYEYVASADGSVRNWRSESECIKVEVYRGGSWCNECCGKRAALDLFPFINHIYISACLLFYTTALFIICSRYCTTYPYMFSILLCTLPPMRSLNIFPPPPQCCIPHDLCLDQETVCPRSAAHTLQMNGSWLLSRRLEVFHIFQSEFLLCPISFLGGR